MVLVVALDSEGYVYESRMEIFDGETSRLFGSFSTGRLVHGVLYSNFHGFRGFSYGKHCRLSTTRSSVFLFLIEIKNRDKGLSRKPFNDSSSQNK